MNTQTHNQKLKQLIKSYKLLDIQVNAAAYNFNYRFDKLERIRTKILALQPNYKFD